MRTLICCVLAVAALNLGSAHAQTATQHDPVRMDLANQLIDANGGRKATEERMGALMGLMMKNVPVPSGQEPLFKTIMADFQSEMIGMVPAIIELSVKAYADNLTEEELRYLLATQQSPLARSVNAKMPAVMKQVIEQQAPMIAAVLPQLMRRVGDRVCEQQKCTPQQRKLVADAMAKATGAPAS